MKSLCFLGPTHHLNILAPIVSALTVRGWHNVWYTANAEAAFETNIMQELQEDWEWLPFYTDPVQREALYDEALPYFRTMYKDPRVLSLMIPPITDRVIREVCTDWWATKNMLEKVKPDVCLSLHELNRWGMILGYWCNVMGIPFYTFQEGMYYGHPWIYTGHTKYSHSLVWGEATKEKLLASNADPAKVTVVGHPNIRVRWEEAEARKEEGRAVLPPEWADKRLVILYICNVALQHVDVPTLLEGIGASDWRVIVRVATLSSKPLTDKIKEFFAPHAALAYVSKPEDPYWPLLACGEALCVLGCSTLSLEWLARGKPLAEAFSPGQPFSFKEAGLAVDGGNPFSILQWLKTAEDLFATPEHQEKVKVFVQHYIADDHAAERLADIIGGPNEPSL